MPNDLADLFHLAEPLAPLAERLAAAWRDVATRREFEAREVLFAPADPPTALYVIADGRVKLTAVSGEGKELIIALAGRGDLVGELSPVEAGPHRTFAEALERGAAWSIPRDVVRQVLARDAEAALAFMHVHDARSRELEQRLANLVFLEVPQRLAATLLDLTDAPGGDVLLTHYDLAGLIGSTRETTTLMLNKFRTAGWVSLDKRKVHVVDRAALAEVTSGGRTVDA